MRKIPKFSLENLSIERKPFGWVADGLKLPLTTYDKKETELEVEKIELDDKQLLGELLGEFLPVYKRIKDLKDPNEILQAQVRLASMIMFRSMMYGSVKEARAAAKEVLDRVMGKPIERQMQMTMNVDVMNETEVDNEIRKLLREFGSGEETGFLEITAEEEKTPRRDGDGEVHSEPSAETLSRVEGKD